MNIAALPTQVRAANLPLEQLSGNSHLSQTEKVNEVARQFEAVLLRQILTDAQKKIFPSPLNPESSSSGIYQDMITNHLAEGISRSGGFGLAQVLAKQLQHEVKPADAPAAGDSKV